MKILHQKIDKGGEGQVAFVAEQSDDLWLIYNIIQKHDQIRGTTFRKVVNESSTGSTTAHRVKLTLTISVEKVEYDFESDIVKVKGKSIVEHEHVRKGQYHTLELELNKKFYLTKPVWDSLALSQLYNARDLTSRSSPEVAVVIMQEGLAFVCLLTTSLTVQKAKIECNIPRKRKNFCSQHQKGLEQFYELILQAMLKHIQIEHIKCLLIASPGFVKDQFVAYMWQQLARMDAKQWLESKGKVLVAHSSTGFKHSIGELLADKQIQAKLEDTKAVQDVKVWSQFKALLSCGGDQADLAVYGLREVETAIQCKAAKVVMLADQLFRTGELALRKRYSSVMGAARAANCPVHVFSSVHPSGAQLTQLGGLAAILRFALSEVDAGASTGGRGRRAREAELERRQRQQQDEDDADGDKWCSSDSSSSESNLPMASSSNLAAPQAPARDESGCEMTQASSVADHDGRL